MQVILWFAKLKFINNGCKRFEVQPCSLASTQKRYTHSMALSSDTTKEGMYCQSEMAPGVKLNSQILGDILFV